MSELSANGRRRVYRVLVRVARADKRIDPAEVTALREMREVLGLTEDEARVLEAEPESAPLRLGRSTYERQTLARMMVELALADDDVAFREFRLLRQIAGVIGLEQEALVEAIEQATRRRRDG